MSIPGSVHPLFLGASGQSSGYQIERSLLFNSADSAYLYRVPSGAGNRTTWTWAGWVKGSLGKRYFGAGPNPGTTDFAFGFDGNGYFDCFNRSSGVINARLISTSLFRDPSAWHHFVCIWNTTSATNSDRFQIWANGNRVTNFSTATYPNQNAESMWNNNWEHFIGAQTTGDYFNGYLAEIHFIDGQALTPSSFGETDGNGIWQPKAYTGTYGANGFRLAFRDNSAATATTLGADTSGNGNNWTPNNLSVVGMSGYQLVSGVGDSPGSMFDLNVNTATTGNAYNSLTWNGTINLGRGSYYVITDRYAIDGQGPDRINLVVGGTTYSTLWGSLVADMNNKTIGAGGICTPTKFRSALTPVSNGSLTQITAIDTGAGFAYTFYAVIFVPEGISASNFADHVVVQNISANRGNVGGNDSLVDTPTSYGTDTGVGGEVRGNYAVLNPLSKSSNNTFSNGSLEATWNNSAANQAAGAISTIQVTSGKWYWEFTTTLLDQGYPYLGFFTNHSPSSSVGVPWVPSLVSGASWQPDGTISTLGCTKVANAGTYLANDILGFALDRDAGTLRVYKNGVAQNSGNPVVTAITGLIGPGFGQVSSTITANFGQRPFAYAAPSGFKALCTANIPEGTITTSGTFTGNANADGPFIYLNGVPTAMTINGNAVTFATHADKLSNGFKVRNSTSSYNQSGSNTFSVTSTGAKFKVARAQPNP